MKKIVGILAAAAVLATSVFAADFTAGARLEGDLFTYDGASEGLSAVTIKGANNPWNAPFTLSVSSDRAGATWKFTDNKAEHGLATCEYGIWFKPFDIMTVKLGKIAESMNTDSIDWTNRVLNYDSFGYEGIIETNGIKVALAAVTGEDTYWFTKAKGADAALGEFNAFFSYGADFGTISAMFDANNTFKKIGAAIGYKKSMDALTFFVDAAFLKDAANGIVANADVKYAKDAFGVEAYVKFSIGSLDAVSDTMGICAIAKATYALDKGTVYLYIKDGDFMAKDFAMTVKPGFTSSVGIMNYEIAAQFDIASKIKVSVPVNFSVNF